MSHRREAAALTEAEQLRRALRSRDVIGQAKGILMERHKITADEAFAMLASRSKHFNIKLYVIADDLARTGSLPDLPNL